MLNIYNRVMIELFPTEKIYNRIGWKFLNAPFLWASLYGANNTFLEVTEHWWTSGGTCQQQWPAHKFSWLPCSTPCFQQFFSPRQQPHLLLVIAVASTLKTTLSPSGMSGLGNLFPVLNMKAVRFPQSGWTIILSLSSNYIHRGSLVSKASWDSGWSLVGGKRIKTLTSRSSSSFGGEEFGELRHLLRQRAQNQLLAGRCLINPSCPYCSILIGMNGCNAI